LFIYAKSALKILTKVMNGVGGGDLGWLDWGPLGLRKLFA